MRRSNVNIYEPTRQSIAAIVVLIFKFLKRLIDAFWPILLVLVFQGRDSSNSWIGIVGSVVGGLSLLGSILAYFKYYFRVTDQEIIIQKGILKKTNLTIPFERVQAVDFEQNIIHQALNVVKVKIDTAGSAKSELDIDALELPIAEQLRSIIIGYRKKNLAESSVDNLEAEAEEIEKKVLRVDIPELIKVGISQNHLKTAGLIIAFAGAVFNEIEQVFQGFVSSRLSGLEGYFDRNADTWWQGIVIIIIALIIVSFVITLILTVIRYYDLRVTRNNKGFKLIAGLFNRKEISAVHKKVQIVNWGYNPLQGLLGLFRVKILQASSEFNARKTRFLIPGIYEHQLNYFIKEYFSDEALSNFLAFRIHPLIILRYTIIFGVIPATIGVALAYFTSNQLFYNLVWFLPIVLVAMVVYQKNWSLEVNEQCIKTSYGIFGRTFNLVHLYKAQSIQISQSWYQRRNNLANVHIYTAGGHLTIPYLDNKSAEELKNYVLYHIESSRRKWM